jgi:hypothetical protein
LVEFFLNKKKNNNSNKNNKNIQMYFEESQINQILICKICKKRLDKVRKWRIFWARKNRKISNDLLALNIKPTFNKVSLRHHQACKFCTPEKNILQKIFLFRK